MSSKKQTKCLYLKAAIKEWLEWGACGKYSSQTIKAYRNRVLRFVGYTGKTYVKDLNSGDCIAFYQEMKRNGNSTSTINLTMIAIKAYFKYLDIAYPSALSFNKELVPHGSVVIQNSPKPITFNEYRSLIEAIYIYEPKTKVYMKNLACLRDELVFTFLYNTGVRVSELLSLNIEDLNIQSQTTSLITKKSKKERFVFWNNDTQVVLQYYLEQLKSMSITNGPLILNFCWDKRYQFTRMKYECIRHRFARYRRIACIAGYITIHSFRHQYITQSIDRGMPLAYVQKMVGHSKVSSTTVYIQPDVDKLRISYKKIHELS